MALQGIYAFTQSAELSRIEGERQRTIDEQTVGSTILPMADHNTDLVEWEIRDNVSGLMFARDEDAPYPTRAEPGVKRYAIAPGIFGEQRTVPEVKLRSKRQIGDLGAAINVDQELADLQQDLAIQMNWLFDYIRWTLLGVGSVTVAKQDGSTVEVARLDNWASVAPGILFTTYATAVPLQFYAGRVTAYRGLGYDFGKRSILCMNNTTLQEHLNNTNAADLYGRRLALGQTTNSLEDFQDLMSARNLPGVKVVDETYLTTAGVATPFIPNGTVVHVGHHWARGLNCGEFCLTRNGSNMGNPGIYANNGVLPIDPRLPYTVRGANGGPRLNYPNQVKVYQVHA